MISWGNATCRVGQQGTPQAGLCGLTHVIRGRRVRTHMKCLLCFKNTHVSLNRIFSVELAGGPELS